MALVNFSNLDFDQIKTTIKDYLRSNSNFTDYDFEGSNLSTIIDVLAYNTYITSYNANMISNEVFIDSATLRENVVSLARNIGYVPRSRKAAKANISFFVDTTVLPFRPSTLTLRQGIVCSTNSAFGSESYTFVVPQDITRPVSSDGTVFFENIDIYEGSFVTTNFTLNQLNLNQRFILPNSGVDTSLLDVTLRPNESSTTATKFKLADSIFNINGDSSVYFIQEIEDERYELIFGDGIFGKSLLRQSPPLTYIEVSYIISNGSSGNGINRFLFSGNIVSNSGAIVTDGISLVTTNTPSYGGDEIESVESVKRYAPKIYASRNRAVTANDYEAIIPQIYAETQSVSVFGGEEVTPPQYGKVFISIKPENGSILSNNLKNNIKTELKKYSVAGIIPEIIDLKYLYLEIDSKVYYNTNLAPTSDFVQSLVYSTLTQFSRSSEINQFGARFKYSKFLSLIDNAHESITSNITNVKVRRDLTAKINTFATYEICFGNRINIGKQTGYNIKSSGFSVSGIGGVLYLSDRPNADGKTGSVFFFRLLSTNNPQIVREKIGTIDYNKGEILLNPVNIISTSRSDNIIQISAVPYSNDVIGLQDLYLQLDTNNVNITVIPDTISSGSDTSGSNYIVSSSYSNGEFVR